MMTTARATEPQPQKPRTVPYIVGRQAEPISARRAAVLLITITLAAGVMRFCFLSRPPLWIDEGLTFWRVCGTYDQLLETLRDDGFVPLHYELLWWIGRHWPLTPFVMRFIPALCGTLLVPIMYFLARQLLGRRTALVTALLVACSAYVSNYARDAKMYMPAWTLAALTMACLLWWVRTNKFIAWEAWIASGIAAAGCHVVTMLLLPVAPLLVLSQPRHRWQQSLWMLAGLAIIAAGPIGYYTHFNQWNTRSGGLVPGIGAEPAADANWHASGLDWIRGDPDGLEIMSRSASTYLTAYEYLSPDSPDVAMASRPWVQAAINWSLATIAGILVLGVIPWPYAWRGTARDTKPTTVWWRSFLVLSTWILVPGYCFFYCRSTSDFATPWEMIRAIPTLGIQWYWWLLGGCVLLLAWWLSGGTIGQRLIRAGQFALVCVLLIVVCSIAAVVWRHLREESFRRFPDLPWHNVFQVRYMGIVMPAVWLAVAALVMRLPFRITRVLAVAILVAVNLTNSAMRVFGDTEVRLDQVYADFWQSRAETSTRTYEALHESFFNLLDNQFLRPAGAYYAWLASRLETSPELVRIGKSWPFEYGPMMQRFRQDTLVRPYVDADRIAADLKSEPMVWRLIVWDFQQPSQTLVGKDDIAEKLGAGWNLKQSQSSVFRRYWTWEEVFWIRRREYQKN